MAFELRIGSRRDGVGEASLGALTSPGGEPNARRSWRHWFGGLRLNYFKGEITRKLDPCVAALDTRPIRVTRVAVPVLALCLCGGAVGASPAPVAGTLVVESVNGTEVLPSNALLVMAPNGRQRGTLIRRGRVDYQLPAWSPEASRIAYGRCDLNDVCRIGIVNVRTRRARLLAPAGGAPSWSPNGRKLAFAAGQLDVWGRLSTIPVAGGRATRLARGLVIDSPAWSPDGRYIAFVALRGVDDTAAPWLYVIRPDGRGLRRLISVGDVAADTEIGELRPSWSPDSRSIAIAGDGEESVIVVDLLGRVRWRLERLRGLVFGVCWSPDGRRIAFDDDGTVHIVDRNGTNVQPLTAGRPYTWVHGWDPSSRKLAITRGTSASLPPTSLALLDAQTGREQKLLDGRVGDVAWGRARTRR